MLAIKRNLQWAEEDAAYLSSQISVSQSFVYGTLHRITRIQQERGRVLFPWPHPKVWESIFLSIVVSKYQLY